MLGDGEVCQVFADGRSSSTQSGLTGPFSIITQLPHPFTSFLACEAASDTCHVINSETLAQEGVITDANLGGSPGTSTLVAVAQIESDGQVTNVSSLYVGRPESDEVMSTKRVREEAGELVVETMGEYWDTRMVEYASAQRSVISDDFLAVFEYRNFVFYLIRTVRGERISTRLGRVCKSDARYDSYTEIELRCTHGGSVLTDSTVASLLQAGDDSTLFVVFSSNQDESGELIGKHYLRQPHLISQRAWHINVFGLS